MLFHFLPLFRVSIKENSMSPYLKNGDNILAIKYFFSKPKVGEIIIFKHTAPPFIFIKRITKDINDNYFVEGDNKKESVDSREFGYVKRNQILGKMILKI